MEKPYRKVALRASQDATPSQKPHSPPPLEMRFLFHPKKVPTIILTCLKRRVKLWLTGFDYAHWMQISTLPK